MDHSSNLPDPIALSSAEAEYNEACIAFMSASHLVMLLNELEFVDQYDQDGGLTPIFFDSTSAIAMGNSFRDTRHTRHIMRRHHYVREQIELGIYITLWIATLYQLADIGTKQTPGPHHGFLREFVQVPVDDQSLVKDG